MYGTVAFRNSDLAIFRVLSDSSHEGLAQYVALITS